MRNSLRFSAAAILLAVHTTTTFAAGAGDPLAPIRLATSPLVGRPRSQAPQTLDLVLENRHRDVLEGELQLRVYVAQREIFDYRTGLLAVAPGQQRLRVMLPAITVHHEKTPVTAVARFVGKRFDFDLGEHDIVVPVYWKRWLVIGISQPEERRTMHDEMAIPSALVFERFNANMAERSDIVSYPSPIAPNDLPSTVAGYCSLDLLVLEGDGLADLREAQLSAIAGWVEAGGSICIRPTGQLKPAHIAFLNRLTIRGAADELFFLDERANLIPEYPGVDSYAMRHFGLGRVVIIGKLAPPEGNELPSEWREISTFLWKIRADQRWEIQQTGYWNFTPPTITYDIRRPRPYAPQEPAVEANAGEHLFPANVQGLPLWLVISILGVFLVVIAPLDYFLLGALRLRRLTWWFLAGASLAFTFGTVKIADSAMSEADFHTGLVFVDLGEGNQPVRNSLYELKFTAVQQKLELPFRNTLYARWQERPTRAASINPVQGYYVQPLTVEDELNLTGVAGDIPTFEGRMPGTYSIHQQMRKWSPLLSRQTTFGEDAADLPGIDWSRVTAAKLQTEEGRAELRAELEQRAPGVQSLVYFGTTVIDLQTDGPPTAASTAPPVNVPQPQDETAPQTRIIELTPEILDVIGRSSVRPRGGFFEIVSQVSPTGADGFEDLALLDSNDPRQALLVLITQTDNEIHVYRKLLRADP